MRNITGEAAGDPLSVLVLRVKCKLANIQYVQSAEITQTDYRQASSRWIHI